MGVPRWPDSAAAERESISCLHPRLPGPPPASRNESAPFQVPSVWYLRITAGGDPGAGGLNLANSSISVRTFGSSISVPPPPVTASSPGVDQLPHPPTWIISPVGIMRTCFVAFVHQYRGHFLATMSNWPPTASAGLCSGSYSRGGPTSPAGVRRIFFHRGGKPVGRGRGRAFELWFASAAGRAEGGESFSR